MSKLIHHVLVIVGFPTELFDEDGHHIREVGREYGTTTGTSARRVGWFDSVVLRHFVV